MTGLTLPFRFAPDLLKADLNRIRPDEWTPHYNERDYGGDWQGVALRSASGSARQLVAAPAGESPFLDTPLLERCDYFRRVLETFRCPLKSVRLLSLAPQSYIREHSDNALAFEHGEVRIHIPIQTGPHVEFYLAGDRLSMEEGATYYVNVNLPHRINNHGPGQRVHLVIDAEVNEWLSNLFADSRSVKIPVCLSEPCGFDAFRDIVLRDAGLQRQLQALTDRREFVASIVLIARDRGFQFTPADVEAAFRSPGKFLTAEPPDEYMPLRVVLSDGQPRLEWAWFGSTRLLDPFYDDTARKCLRVPFAAAFRVQTPLLNAGDSPSLAPAGFIFHMSRCGSTLLSQMLTALDRTIVVSEAPPIDDVIQLRNIDGLRSVVRALGKPRTGRESQYFVKLDAWHIHALPFIREAYPQTPWIFLFRDPSEVVASQLRAPGVHCLPGAMRDPRVLGLTNDHITRLTREEWCVQVISLIGESALTHADNPRGMFVDHCDLPQALWSGVADHFGIGFSRDDMERMRAVAGVHSKTRQPWTGSQAEPSELAGVLKPLYHRLKSAEKSSADTSSTR